MNKRMKELLGLIDARQKAAQEALCAGDLDGAQKALDEADALRREYDLTERAYSEQKAEAFEAMGRAREDAKADAPKDVMEKFGHDVKARIKAFSGLSEGVAASSTLIVPEDVSTRVEQLRTARASLLDLVRVTPTTAKSGKRVFQKRATNAGFSEVDEAGSIVEGKSPEFGTYEFDIKKYGGFYPATDELLEDSDANVAALLIDWIADESRATANRLIMGVLNARSATPATSIDDLKKAFNVTLGQAFADTAKVVTNDDGLNWLDCLRDKDGRPLLRENPTDPLNPVLALGFRRVPLVVVPNSVVATTGAKVPFIVGDLYDGVEFFDRKHRTVFASNTASAGNYNAFSGDLTIVRALEREDVVKRDGDAWVRLELDASAAQTE